MLFAWETGFRLPCVGVTCFWPGMVARVYFVALLHAFAYAMAHTRPVRVLALACVIASRCCGVTWPPLAPSRVLFARIWWPGTGADHLHPSWARSSLRVYLSCLSSLALSHLSSPPIRPLIISVTAFLSRSALQICVITDYSSVRGIPINGVPLPDPRFDTMSVV